MLLNLRLIILVLLLATLTVSCDELLNQTQDEDVPPDSPSNFIIQRNNSVVEMSWSDRSDNEDGFKVEYQQGSSIVWNPLVERAANQSSFVWDGAQEGETYAFRVCAWNAVDYSEWAYSASLSMPLMAPTSLTTNLTQSAVELQWRDNSGREESQVIERAEGTGAFSTIGTVSANEQYYTDSEYPEGVTVSYRVKAMLGEVSSDYSNIASVITPGHINPPTNLTAVIVDRKPELSWTDNTEDEDGFQIEYKYSTDDIFYFLTNVDRNVTNYRHETASPESEITYRVSAFVGYYYSDPSNEATATTPPVPTMVTMTDFNSYPNGITFTGSSDWFVYNSDAQNVFYISDFNQLSEEGNNLSFWDDADASWGYADYTFDGVGDGWVEFDLRVTGSDGMQDFAIALSVDHIWSTADDFGPFIEFDSNGYLQAYDGTTFYNVWNYTVNHWTHIKIEFQAVQGTYTVYADDVAILTDYSFRNDLSGDTVVGFTIVMFSDATLDRAQIDNVKIYDNNNVTHHSVPATRLDGGRSGSKTPIQNR